MKGFHSPEAEGNFEVITEDVEVETQTTILQKKAGTYPVEKGNATHTKGWRTINALSE